MGWPRKGWLRSFEHDKLHIQHDLCGVYNKHSDARTLSVPRDQRVHHPWYARQCKTRPQCAAWAVLCGGV